MLELNQLNRLNKLFEKWHTNHVEPLNVSIIKKDLMPGNTYNYHQIHTIPFIKGLDVDNIELYASGTLYNLKQIAFPLG